MSNIKITNQTIPAYIRVALILTIVGLALIALGSTIFANTVGGIILNAVGGGTISLGWVEILHEWAIARKVREEFLILGDYANKGIKRLSTIEETVETGRDALLRTKSLKVMGIGISWLVTGNNRTRLIAMLTSHYEVKILMPDPCSSEINDRYTHDEPPEFELGLPGLATVIKSWYNLCKEHSSLELRVYHIYPVATVTIYDDEVYVGPVLFKQRAKNNLSIIFRRHSQGADPYEEHFNQVYFSASKKVDDEYIKQLCQQFPNT